MMMSTSEFINRCLRLLVLIPSAVFFGLHLFVSRRSSNTFCRFNSRNLEIILYCFATCMCMFQDGLTSHAWKPIDADTEVSTIIGEN